MSHNKTISGLGKASGLDDRDIELELVKDHIETLPIGPRGPGGPRGPVGPLIKICVLIYYYKIYYNINININIIL